jgi:flagellar hook-length control protein FliK
MTQIAIIQAAPQSVPTDTPLTKDKANPFTPHLKRAVTEAEQNSSETPSSNSTSVTDQSNPISATDQLTTDSPELINPDLLSETPELFAINPDAVTDHFEDNIQEAFNIVNAVITSAENLVGRDKKLPLILDLLQKNELSLHTLGQKLETQSEEQKQPIHPVRQNLTLQPFNFENVRQTPEQDFALQPAKHDLTLQVDGRRLSSEITGKEPIAQPTGLTVGTLPETKNGAEPFVQRILSSLSGAENRSINLSPLAPSENNNTPLKMDLTTPFPPGKENPIPQIAQNQSLVQQLQQIINNGNESGTVSIQGSVSGYSLQNYIKAESATGGIVSTQILDQSKFTEKSDTKIPALRQDMLSQYFEAKINTRELGDSGPNAQGSDQQNSTNNQQLSTTLQQPSSSISTEQPGSFQHVSTLMQHALTSQTQNSTNPVTLRSGSVISEADVMQQVIDRFQINTRARDIKISLKLHPQELGELKIDLTMKEGYIKANVIVHSQQVHEIIEKNLLKLKTAIEDQGFSVEDITVTSESESVPDFDLFEQHLSNQKDFSPANPKTENHNDFDMALEDAVEQSTESTTGVNIKA